MRPVMDTKTLLKEVDRYLSKAKLSEATLGRKAVNDGKAIKRLRSGGRMWPETAQRLRQFMADNPDLRGRAA